MPAPTPASPQKAGYDVSRPAGRCIVSGREIAPGERFMAGLRDTPAGFERVDVAMDQWESVDKASLLGFWQTTMPQGEAKKRLFVDDNVLLDLFERLAETDDPARLRFRFILGLILMRKRLVQYEASRTDDGREFWTMRIRGKDARTDLLNPQLSADQVSDVSEQLSQILSEGA